jgi:hypothetical protein
MKGNKKVIIIGGVVIAAVVIAGVVWGVHRNNNSDIEFNAKTNKNEMGIHYGGSFNEFQYFDEDSTEDNDEKESSLISEITDSINSDNEELSDDEQISEELSKIAKEFEENAPGINIDDIESSNNVGNIASINADINSDNYSGDNDDIDNLMLEPDGYAENEVLCDAETMEEATQIANQISGTVKSCENGVAVIQIEKNVDTLLDELESQGSSLRLYRNYKYTIN